VVAPNLNRVAASLLTVLTAACLIAGCSAPAAGASGDQRPVRILAGGPATLDPAAAGDAGSSNVIGQLYETLTSFDTTLALRPALAESWDIQEGGRRMVFRLRDDLTFSDGTPLTGDDVVRSWMRIIDPASPSPLVALMADVEGAMAYARGQNDDPSSVGLRADGQEVTVDLNRPAADFVTVVASPTFSVVPPGIDDDPGAVAPGTFIGSGGYTVDAASPPITARPSGASCSAPNATGTMPAIMANVVIRIGRRRLVAPRIAARSAAAPSTRYCSAKVASKIAFATATPIAMIAPMNDCTFNVLLVRNRLSATPAMTAGIVPITISATFNDWK